MKLPRGFLASLRRPGKKAVIWSAAAVLLVVIIGYVLWSQQLWAQYQPSYTQWRQDIYAEVNNVVALPAETEDERQVVVMRYAGIAKHIEDTEQAVCQVSNIVAWQVNLSNSLANARTECEAMIADVKAFKVQLHKVVMYLQNDQAVAEIINAVPQTNELTGDAWPAQEAAWKQASQSIERLSVDGVFKPTQTLAIKQVAAIEASWGNVIKAHKAKDKKQYMAAQAALLAAYDGLHEMTASSEEILEKLSGQLHDSSVAAFGVDL